MFINTIIVEDEKPAAKHLERLLNRSRHEVRVQTVTDSLTSTIGWLAKNPMPDILLLDIQLSDGLSFELFKHTTITCPVIFTTAYAEYAIRAFKVNSIDYLLKPIDPEELELALDKYLKQTLTADAHRQFQDKMDQMMRMLKPNYKSRFMVNAGAHIRSIEADHIRYFQSMEKATFLIDDSGKSYDIDYSLDQLEAQLNPAGFFRINRQFIVHIDAIEDIVTYSSSRLKIITKGDGSDDIIVARNRVKSFKEWLDRDF